MPCPGIPVGLTVGVIEGVPGVHRVISWKQKGQREPDWDLQMEVTELPRAFRTTIATVPDSVPYIHVPQERMEWASRWFGGDDGLRVGLVWRAGPWDLNRSLDLDEFAPLFARGELELYSLQKGVDPFTMAGKPLRDLAAYSADIRDTAAMILNLDLVISVDTMTAHLAGALGRPVWILLPEKADWRWMLGRSDTPWYPTARLFRQTRAGGWEEVIQELISAMGQVALEHPHWAYR